MGPALPPVPLTHSLFSQVPDVPFSTSTPKLTSLNVRILNCKHKKLIVVGKGTYWKGIRELTENSKKPGEPEKELETKIYLLSFQILDSRQTGKLGDCLCISKRYFESLTDARLRWKKIQRRINHCIIEFRVSLSLM